MRPSSACLHPPSLCDGTSPDRATRARAPSKRGGGRRPRLVALGLADQSVQRYLEAADGEQTLQRAGEDRLRYPPLATHGDRRVNRRPVGRGRDRVLHVEAHRPARFKQQALGLRLQDGDVEPDLAPSQRARHPRVRPRLQAFAVDLLDVEPHRGPAGQGGWVGKDVEYVFGRGGCGGLGVPSAHGEAPIGPIQDQLRNVVRCSVA